MNDLTNNKKTLHDLYRSKLYEKIVIAINTNEIINLYYGNKLSSYQSYLWMAHVKASKILSTFKSLELIIDFISEYHPKNYKTKYSIDSDTKYLNELNYHIENFYYRIVKIKDLLLIFISYILLLNIEERKCNYDRLIKEIKILSGKNKSNQNNYKILTSLIIKFRESISEFENIRNKIIHRENYWDKNIDIITGILFGREMMKNPDYSQELSIGHNISNEKVEKYIGEIIDIKLKEFKNFKSNLTNRIYHFFDILVVFYEISIKNVKC